MIISPAFLGETTDSRVRYTMKKNIEEILNHSEEQGVNRWTLNTTRSNLIGHDLNDRLSIEIDNWETHKKFAHNYGLMFNYPEDYLSIYLLISLLKNYRILCNPDEQRTNSTLDKLNLQYKEVRWHYSEEIHHDKNYNYYIESKIFRQIMFNDLTSNKGILKTMLDLATKGNSRSRMYELINSHQIHQAVICGGNGDVDKCPNYYGIKSNKQKESLIDILSKESKPKLNHLLENCEFFIADYKGEDIGYARQFNLYTRNDEVNLAFKSVLENFKHFQLDLKELNLNSENLNEYIKKLNEIEIKYGC